MLALGHSHAIAIARRMPARHRRGHAARIGNADSDAPKRDIPIKPHRSHSDKSDMRADRGSKINLRLQK